MDWHLFARERGGNLWLNSVTEGDPILAEFTSRHGKHGSFVIEGKCDGIPILTKSWMDWETDVLGRTEAVYEGGVAFGGSIKGEILVRNGSVGTSYAELILPGFQHPVCLIKENPELVASPLTVVNLEDAVATLYPQQLASRVSMGITAKVLEGYTYCGIIRLKRNHSRLSELSRCSICLMVAIADFVVEPEYMRID